MARKRVKRVRIRIELDVELEPGYERDIDVKASLRDAVEEWQRRERRIHGREPGQLGPGFPPPSTSGETVALYFAEDHPTRSGQKWGTMTASWEIYDPKEEDKGDGSGEGQGARR